MGLGDVTLMAFVGAALGPTRALITVFLGATLGAVAFARRRDSGRAAAARVIARADGACARIARRSKRHSCPSVCSLRLPRC